MAPSSMLKSAILILTCVITRALSIVTLDKEAMTTNECDADTPMVVPNFKVGMERARPSLS